jgi:hypothetical protein
LEDHRMWVFLTMHAAIFSIDRQSPGCLLFRSQGSRRGFGFGTAHVRMDPPHDSLAWFCPKAERRDAEPTRLSQTSRRRKGAVRWEPDAGSPVGDTADSPKVIH